MPDLSIARLLSFTAALVATGCVVAAPSKKYYDGPALPAAEIARIESYSAFYGAGGKAITIVTIDGKHAPECPELRPGRYVVGMKYDAMAGEVTISGLAPCFVTLDAEAGHLYRTGGELGDGAWKCWIEDRATAKRTMGQFVRGGVVPAENESDREAATPTTAP
jgi:hypothetical protein